METLENLHFDRTGFLNDPAQWNEAIAEEIARQDEVGPLTPTHWQIIRYLRESWINRHALPSMSHTCHLVGRDPACMEALFHGPREAWRIAGLPDPGEEARAYM
ncbi:MAG: TusE/DsrC/DsvC family sulfur relay protein [Burkholderiales bacterium]|nr:TusE/DsrC/DsvC family sulfur relay protein [Burkholderiales bacterium]